MTLPSLRSRLLVLLLGAVAAVWAALAVVSYVGAHHEIDQMFDAQLAQSGELLLAQATHEIYEIDSDESRFEHKYQRHIVFQIWDRDGNLLLHSSSLPQRKLANRPGFGDIYLGKEKWRVFVKSSADGEYQVQVAESHRPRSKLSRNIALRMLLPALLALPVLAALVWLGVGRGLLPLGRLAYEVAGREPLRLTALDTAQTPREVLPLVEALNKLFQRLDETLQNERRFTADAAHELRTPLAALRVQAQVALRAGDGEVRQRALEQIMAGVDRATHLVEQLLTLARLDPDAPLAAHAPVDLRAIAADAVAALAPLAVARHTELGLADGPSAMVIGEAAMLGILTRNLVDNAVRYTPDGSKVEVAVRLEKNHAVLEVSDNGPGIQEAEQDRVLERFYRGLGSGQSGSGLGLSIVKRVLELHHAQLFFGEGLDGRGLKVRVIIHRANNAG